MKCPFCSQEIKDNAKFCTKCGREIPRCPTCGKVVYKRTRFCTDDGTPLPEELILLLPDGNNAEKKKKNNGAFVLLIALAVLVMALVFGFIGFAVMNGSLSRVLSKFGWESFNNSPAKENVPEEDEKKNTQTGKKQSEHTSADATVDMPTEEPKEDYSSIDINAVDNVTIEVSGTVEKKKQQYILKLTKEVSVCAYDLTDKVIVADGVKSMAFSEGSNMENYVEAEVTVTAGLSADESEHFVLEVIGLTVDKESPDGKTAYLSHNYKLIMADVTWQEAFEDCISRGGYLIRINSAEEFLHVINLIEKADMRNIHFYLGGTRKRNAEDYHWIDVNGKFIGDSLNPEGNLWSADYWMKNEPSFVADGDEEMYMNLFYYKDNWVLNDVPLDITQYYAGKTAYICEFDE